MKCLNKFFIDFVSFLMLCRSEQPLSSRFGQTPNNYNTYSVNLNTN